MIQGGSVIIADFEDKWGNVTNVGLGEHAVRTQTPPLYYDKRGNVLRYADFESGTPNYYAYAPGVATAVRSTYTCLTGNFSMKLTSPSLTDLATIWIRTADFHGKTAGIQAVFSNFDNLGRLFFRISNYTGSHEHKFEVSYDYVTGDIFLYSDDYGGWGLIGNRKIGADFHSFSTIKLVGNYITGKYKYLLLFGNEYNVSTVNRHTSISVMPPHLRCRLYYGGVTSTSIIYIDNIIVTENE